MAAGGIKFIGSRPNWRLMLFLNRWPQFSVVTLDFTTAQGKYVVSGTIPLITLDLIGTQRNPLALGVIVLIKISSLRSSKSSLFSLFFTQMLLFIYWPK